MTREKKMHWLKTIALIGLLFLCACCVEQAEGSSPVPVVKPEPLDVQDTDVLDVSPDATIEKIAQELETLVEEDEGAEEDYVEDGEKKDEASDDKKENKGGGVGGGGTGLGSAPADFDEGPDSPNEAYTKEDLAKLRRTTKRLEKTSQLQGQLIKAYEQKTVQMNKDLDNIIRQLEEERKAPSPVE